MDTGREAQSGTRSEAPDPCACCREEIDSSWPDYTRTILPICGHVFHTACIAQWLIQSHTCPLCRCLVQARERAYRDKSPFESVAVYKTLDAVTAALGIMGILYRVLLVLGLGLGVTSNMNVFRIIAEFSDTIRWTLYLAMEVMLRGDRLHYDAISPVIRHHLSVLWRCATVQCICIIIYQLMSGMACATFREFFTEGVILVMAMMIELVTQCCLTYTRDSLSKRVTVNVDYLTTLTV